MRSEQNNHSSENRASPSSSDTKSGESSRATTSSRREKIRTLRARIERLIDKNGPTECHLWLGQRTECGLPKIVADDGQRFIVSRFIFGRYIPRGWHVVPACKQAACCNPRHMRLVPYKPTFKRRRTRLKRNHSDPGKV